MNSSKQPRYKTYWKLGGFIFLKNYVYNFWWCTSNCFCHKYLCQKKNLHILSTYRFSNCLRRKFFCNFRWRIWICFRASIGITVSKFVLYIVDFLVWIFFFATFYFFFCHALRFFFSSFNWAKKEKKSFINCWSMQIFFFFFDKIFNTISIVFCVQFFLQILKCVKFEK